MNPAARIVEHLRSQGVSSAVIGGVAMAVHGIARATVDLDLLVVAPEVLTGAFWLPLSPAVTAEVRRGDASDPLAGVVRCVSDETVVDVVVGASPWMIGVIARATPRDVLGERLPVAEAADLVLLKLYAGGPQDMLDVRLLLAADPGLRTLVASRIDALPTEISVRLEKLEAI